MEVAVVVDVGEGKRIRVAVVLQVAFAIPVDMEVGYVLVVTML